MRNLLKKYKHIGDAGFLLIANLVVNIGNYGLNIILGRWLGPEGFADANLLATLVMLLSFIAMGLQLVIAKYSAQYQALEQSDKLDSLVSNIYKIVLKWKAREPKPMVDCNGFCGTNDLIKRLETEKETI